jgi:3',5'-cyclic AMP phosphodiesterase CpdA
MWRFIQLSDTHLGGQFDDKGNNRLIGRMMPDVIRCLRNDLSSDPPDFALVTGDITMEQTRDAMFAARDLLDSLGFPYYPIGGNADFVNDETRRWFADAFKAQIPGSETVYSMSHKGLHFAMLDPWWNWPDGSLLPVAPPPDQQCGWSVPPWQFDWLKRDFDSHRDEPTLVVVHYPCTPVPERMRAANMVDHGHLSNGDLLSLFLQCFPQVKAVLNGHAHMHIGFSDNALWHITTAALIEYPNEYREARVHSDRIEFHCRALSESRYSASSLIEGREWTGGEEQDRTIIVPLG